MCAVFLVDICLFISNTRSLLAFLSTCGFDFFYNYWISFKAVCVFESLQSWVFSNRNHMNLLQDPSTRHLHV